MANFEQDLFGNKYWDIWVSNIDAFTKELYRGCPWRIASEVPAQSFVSACQLFFMNDERYDPVHNSYEGSELWESSRV